MLTLADSRTTLIGTALAASVVTACTILGFQRWTKKAAISEFKRELQEQISVSGSAFSQLGASDPAAEEELVREQLSRNYAFLGENGAARVRGSFVIVVGVGGVGSHAAHMLLRAGVERLRLIDFDQVTLSSLNRHAVATQADVGTPKVVCLQRHFQKIFPKAKVEACVEMFQLNSAGGLLNGNPDFVLDCIDNLQTKIQLIKYCYESKLRVISSMGAGAKADPSRIQIADISETYEDPLARTTRRALKKEGIESGVQVVYSTEKPGTVKLLPLDEDKVSTAQEFATLPDFRVRILPVLGTIPALFGMAMASYVITELAHFPTSPLAIKNREPTYTRIHRDICNREKDVYASSPHIPLSIADVGYIFDEIWRGRSALSGAMDKVTLCRWDRTKPISFGNVVCLSKTEAAKHDLLAPEQLEEHYGPEFIALVRRKFEEEREINKWRL
ncbi:uncharacterized protein BJ171DRAFT_487499 [Polychytrium aggregatum]|uniref:uncharacterized protein n=1 Tax=Polychytrium aggregatum TaxID=110093 RepID=UPI0022FDB7DF|nr:uncharacterized protein BJ171DRAFT_487499 [Polychytrium aggregatum]KAI9208851.1 hypothetical protein BJ171DRAFT_487499 [Polychytrium aggregatum]